jgi:Z1 domain
MSIVVRELKSVRPKLNWKPFERKETTAFVDRKNKKNGIPIPALHNVVFEAQQILGRCINPTAPQQGTTGLVVGFVQSGKTLSFTTLCALAHDNDFGLIILIAGTIENLLLQTKSRLESDLDLDGNGSTRPWMVVDRPSPGTPEAGMLQRHLSNWVNPSIPKDKKRVCLVVVLKQHKRLASLRQCLQGIDLTKVPTLVIDDEADQASLNTFAAKNRTTGSNRKSTNYGEVLALKDVLPHHSYVQYTATPQANLLISLNDKLTPEFAELLTPGDGYVGGSTLFKAHGAYAATIPDAEASATFATSIGPPPTLVKALRVFLLGACAAEELKVKTNRTMMVHPSQQTGPHNDYLRWVLDLVESWRVITADETLLQVFFDDFKNAYADLYKTVGAELPSFESLVNHLSLVMRLVSVREVNSTGTGAAAISWTACEYWILVGGAKLDRGFTVEGLTVTYMPRPLALGNADSLQQRARFYGYKQKYLGYCRVYLRGDVRGAFEQYVEHEADIHISLEKTRGLPLKDWVRQFTLDSSMQPTRKGVIGIPVTELVATGWMQPKAAHLKADFVKSNRYTLVKFQQQLDKSYAGENAAEINPARYIDKRVSSPRNIHHGSVPLEFVIDEFLKKLQMGHPDDAFQLAGSILALRRLIESGDAIADVFVMGELQPQNRSRTTGDTIKQVYSGKAPAGTNDRAQLNYGGDKDFIATDRVTIHLRTFNMIDDFSNPELANIPWYAIHIPDSFRKRYLLQADK